MSNAVPTPKAPVTGPAQAASAADSQGTIAAHLTAIIAAVVAVITLVHPGFHPPAIVQASVAPVAAAAAVLIEAVHLITHRGLKAALATAWADVEKFLGGKPPSPAAPTPKPAATPTKAPAAAKVVGKSS